MSADYPRFDAEPGEVSATVYAAGVWGDVWCVEIATDASRPLVVVREGYGIWLCRGDHKANEECRPTKVVWGPGLDPPFAYLADERKDRVYVSGLPRAPGEEEESILATTDPTAAR